MKTLLQIIDEFSLSTPDPSRYPGTDKSTVHSYVQNFYEREFFKYQGLPDFSLLEIGVCNGSSLKLWAEYFHPNAVIVGVDPSDAGLQFNLLTNQSIWFIRDDAYRPNIFPKEMRFDVIIDDGPHSLLSQIGFIAFYTRYLKPGGMMVIEDVADVSYTAEFDAILPSHLLGEVHDFRDLSGREDDVLYVIKHKKMPRRFQYDSHDANGSPVPVILDEDQIRAEFWEPWCELMKKMRAENRINWDNCLSDWVSLNWAWEVVDGK